MRPQLPQPSSIAPISTASPSKPPAVSSSAALIADCECVRCVLLDPGTSRTVRPALRPQPLSVEPTHAIVVALLAPRPTVHLARPANNFSTTDGTPLHRTQLSAHGEAIYSTIARARHRTSFALNIRSLLLTAVFLRHHITMGYEDSVYLAKLAEQAERYEGKHICNAWRVAS